MAVAVHPIHMMTYRMKSKRKSQLRIVAPSIDMSRNKKNRANDAKKKEDLNAENKMRAESKKLRANWAKGTRKFLA